MSRIFISYRRADTSGYVIAIYDRLAKQYDPAYIFRDLDTIDYGDDFVERIEQAVQSCDVLLAIIGRSWASVTDSNGRRRLDNPHDFVRLEVATALRRGIRVIPLLVGGASMPYADELPDDLKSLSRRNALEISDRDFHPHMDRLIRAIDRALEAAKHAQDILAILPPPFEWCEIPSGKVTLVDASDYGGTKGGTYDVPAFAITKYPITNAQYQVFIGGKEGYRDPKWWDYSKHAKKWRNDNAKPKDTAYPGDDLPRTNVSWYDSLAFCRWLATQLNPFHDSPPFARGGDGGGVKWQITLPTEQQWQRTAQGDNGRVYPWGNDFDKSRCNTLESGIEQPTPVTKYTNGVSPYRVVDMSGNVWEWCLSEWGRESIDLDNSRPRVVRGGSWFDDSYDARAVCRGDDGPIYGSYCFGFRIVAVPLP